MWAFGTVTFGVGPPASTASIQLCTHEEIWSTRVKTAGLAGLGALWLPDYMARPHTARGELVPLFEDWRLDPMPLYIAFPPNRHVSAKLRLFIDWVAALMGQYAPVAA